MYCVRFFALFKVCSVLFYIRFVLYYFVWGLICLDKVFLVMWKICTVLFNLGLFRKKNITKNYKNKTLQTTKQTKLHTKLHKLNPKDSTKQNESYKNYTKKLHKLSITDYNYQNKYEITLHIICTTKE